MIRTGVNNFLMKHIFLKNQNLTFTRNVRNIARRGGNDMKFVEGKVKTVTNFDEYSRITSLKDFVHDVKKFDTSDEMYVEKAFLEENESEREVRELEGYHDMYLSEEKQLKSKVKKFIIERKYFKLEKETNLLTHAAKKQIRFLHKSNPTEWNHKAIAECFPISEAGVKKLLKSDYEHTCSEKIKAHDEDVAKKWEILKSGKFTTLISPKTQRLYKEGKLVDDYFNGNLNLPTVPPAKKVLQIEKKKNTGEFSVIIKTYIDYKEHKLLESGKKENSTSEISVKQTHFPETCKEVMCNSNRKFKYAYQELDNENDEIFAPPKKHRAVDADLPLSEFQEILKYETKSQNKKYQYLNQDILENANENQTLENNSKKPCDIQSCFIKIPKYNNPNINLKQDKSKPLNVYKYDEKLGYQHPVGKVISGNIAVSSKLKKKGKLYKVGQCIYDSNGEFLYKLPS